MTLEGRIRVPSREKLSRSRRETTCDKLAITLPHEVAEAVRSKVRAGDAASVSVFIARAVQEKVENDHLQDILDEVFREQPMTDEERGWADRLLTR